MALSRRSFVKAAGVIGVGGFATDLDGAGGARSPTNGRLGVLVDIPNCIGCRKCEFACQQAAGFPVAPIDSFDDKSVFATHRRPGPRNYTTINEFSSGDKAKPVYAKSNCLHCNEPACASACLVGALKKQDNGAVTYDAGKCMGCRYCMIACPFQIPAYDYDDPLTPQVRKCTFCFDRLAQGDVPACVKICPNDALTFGRRDTLIALAHERIRSRPDTYVDHIYGEHEAGGTSWLYLSSVPFEALGFLDVGAVAPSRLTEAVQHAVFKYFMPPLALYLLLGIIMRQTKPDARPGRDTERDSPISAPPERNRTPAAPLVRKARTGAAHTPLVAEEAVQ